MRQLFNEIIKRNNFTPKEWKKVKIKVIHKKGDVENVSNYRHPVEVMMKRNAVNETGLQGSDCRINAHTRL